MQCSLVSAWDMIPRSLVHFHISHIRNREINAHSNHSVNHKVHNSSLPADRADAPAPPAVERTESLTIKARMSTSKSLAAILVTSATVSYGGLTSTTSAPTSLTPSSPLMKRLTSRVVQPPLSGVPVAGAILGSRTSMSMLR